MRSLTLLILLVPALAQARQRDTDGDGVPNRVDLCPDMPEDVDNHLDGDGCPEPDNDLDGIPDGSDECPDEAEDPDGYMDADGCPDLVHLSHAAEVAVSPEPRLVQALAGLERAAAAHAGGCDVFAREANAWTATWGQSLPGLFSTHLAKIEAAPPDKRHELSEALQAPLRATQGHLVGVRASCGHDLAAQAGREAIEATLETAWGP